MSDEPDDERDYHSEGFDAWLHGLCIGDNPYAEGTPAAWRWEAGWLEAEEMA